MNSSKHAALLIAVLAFSLSWWCSHGEARTISVGPNGEVSLPSQAAAIAQDGDVVEIEAGIYRDTTIWSQNNLILRSVDGPVTLQAPTNLADNKGIWVIRGNNVMVVGISFVGAQLPDNLGGNGAGIRHEGGDLHIIGSSFIENQDGILGTGKDSASVVIESSEFRHNGTSSGFTHNIYITGIKSFTLLHSISHLAFTGHEIKSRAKRNVIAYNFIGDGAKGTASYEIDLPNGGDSLIIGNILKKGADAPNGTFIAFGEEDDKSGGAGYIVSNTFVSARMSATFVMNRSQNSLTIANNLFAGAGTVVAGPASLTTNLQFITPSLKEKLLEIVGFGESAGTPAGVQLRTGPPGFRGEALLDYALTSDSPALNAGTALPATPEGFSLVPTEEFTPSLVSTIRPPSARLNVGAY